MHKIFDQPYFDLTDFVDIDALQDLRPHLVDAIVRSWAWAKPSRNTSAGLWDKTKLGMLTAMKEARQHPERFPSQEFLDGLIAHDLLASYLRFEAPVTYGSHTINLRYTLDAEAWKNRGDPSNVACTPAYDNFQFFFDWLDTQRIFDLIGRAAIYVNETGVATAEHRDYAFETDMRTQFIWINLDGRKNFYVRDEQTQERHYIPKSVRVAVFDDRNYHGTDIAEMATWSLRIDGMYCPEFLIRTGLDRHFNC